MGSKLPVCRFQRIFRIYGSACEGLCIFRAISLGRSGVVIGQHIHIFRHSFCQRTEQFIGECDLIQRSSICVEQDLSLQAVIGEAGFQTGEIRVAHNKAGCVAHVVIPADVQGLIGNGVHI